MPPSPPVTRGTNAPGADAAPDRRPVALAAMGVLLALFVFAGLYQNERDSALREMGIAATRALDGAISRTEENLKPIKRMAHRWEIANGTTWDAWVLDGNLHLQHLPALKGLIWSSADLSDNWVLDASGSARMEGVDSGDMSEGSGAWNGTQHFLPRSSGPRELFYGGPGFHYEVQLDLQNGRAGGVLRAVFGYRDLVAPAFWSLFGLYEPVLEVQDRAVFGKAMYGGDVAATVSRRVLGETWRLSLAPIGPLVPLERLVVPLAASLLIAFLGVLAAASFHFRSRAALRATQASEAHDRMQAAIEALGSPFAFFDSNDRLVYWNRAFTRLHGAIANSTRTGVTYGELVKAAIKGGHISEAVGREEAYFKNRMDLHSEQGFEVERQLLDGQWRQTTEKRLPDGSTVTLITDITGQKQRETELKAQRDRLAEMREQLKLEQQKFQTFAEASADWFWVTDADHRYTWLSEAIEKYITIPREDLYGQSRIELGQPDEHDPEWEAHVRQMEAREPFRDALFNWDSANGTVWIRSSGIPQFDAEGNFTGYFGSGKDITELKKVEERYAAVRDQLAMAVDSISEGIMIFDANDQLVLCNENFRSHAPDMGDALTTGADYTEIIHEAARNILPQDWTGKQRQDWLDRRLNLRDSDDPVMEFENRLGEWVRVTEHRTANGGTVMVRSDITDLKQRQIELEIERNNADQANRAKTDFLTNMSHELRTPLNAIIGFADIMTTGIYGPLDQRYSGYAGDIGDSGRHLLSLINDLLDGARIESGKYALETDDYPLDDQIRQVEALMQPMLEDRSLGLKHTGAVGRGLQVHIDQRAFKQILLNILSNAAKFSHEGGVITFDASASGDDLIVRISDNGIGLSGHDLERVFERFVQVQDPLRRSHDGTGIGLPLSRSLAELHGGTLHLEQGERGGVTAVLRLPGAIVGGDVEPMRSIA